MKGTQTRTWRRKHTLLTAAVVLVITIITVTYLLPEGGPVTVALPRLIRTDGVYLSGDSNCKLLVESNEDGNLRVTLQNAADNAVLITGTFGGIYQRWFVYWDKDDSVWIHTSDLRSSPWVWVCDPDGRYIQMRVKSSQLVNAVPRAVMENLPTSRQRELGSE